MTDLWVSYPDRNTALHGVQDTDAKFGYPHVGVNLATGLPDPAAQQTTTWAVPVIRVDSKWCFPAPPDPYKPSTGYETFEPYDPNWFIGPPTLITAPVISGGKLVGETMQCSTGEWMTTPVLQTYSYQWRRGGVDVAGATQNTYLLTAADHYAYFTCLVTATNEHGSTPIETPQVWGPIGP